MPEVSTGATPGLTGVAWRERVTAHLTTLGTHVGEGTASNELQTSIALEPDGAITTTCAIADAVRPVVALWARMDDEDVADPEYGLALLDRNPAWHHLRLAAASEIDEDFYDLEDDSADVTALDDELGQLVSASIAEVAGQVSAQSFHDRWTLESRMIKHLATVIAGAPEEIREAFDNRRRSVLETVRERIKVAVEDLHIKEVRERANEYAQEMLDDDPSLLGATKPHRRGAVNRHMKLRDSYCMTVDSADVVAVALEGLIARRGSGQALFEM